MTLPPLLPWLLALLAPLAAQGAFDAEDASGGDTTALLQLQRSVDVRGEGRSSGGGVGARPVGEGGGGGASNLALPETDSIGGVALGPRRTGLCGWATARAGQVAELVPEDVRRAFDAATLERMAASPTNWSLQVQSCQLLGAQLARGGASPELAPLLAAMDRTAARALAAQPPDLAAATTCLGAAVRPAVFNRPYTLLLNRSTHALEHVISLLRGFPNNASLQKEWLTMIAVSASIVVPELGPVVGALGGFDVLFAAIDRFRGMPDVMMSAWRGLSDPSHSAYGAAAIANRGGALKGIDFIVGQMRSHPQPHLAEDPYDHLTLKYEIMQIASGLLQNDAAGVYGAALVAAGFLPQMLYAMRAEPDLRATQDIACRCMVSLVERNASVAKPLADQGAALQISAAVRRFRSAPDNTPWCGTTLGAVYPVVPPCSRALELVAAAG